MASSTSVPPSSLTSSIAPVLKNRSAARLAMDPSDSPGPTPATPSLSSHVRWHPDLHRCFEEAVAAAGGAFEATPTRVRELMGVPQLTTAQVKSHLQKYRIKLSAQNAGRAADRARPAKRRRQGDARGPSRSPSTSSRPDSGATAPPPPNSGASGAAVVPAAELAAALTHSRALELALASEVRRVQKLQIELQALRKEVGTLRGAAPAARPAPPACPAPPAPGASLPGCGWLLATPTLAPVPSVAAEPKLLYSGTPNGLQDSFSMMMNDLFEILH
eukprot:scaffold12.g8045.t1